MTGQCSGGLSSWRCASWPAPRPSGRGSTWTWSGGCPCERRTAPGSRRCRARSSGSCWRRGPGGAPSLRPGAVSLQELAHQTAEPGDVGSAEGRGGRILEGGAKHLLEVDPGLDLLLSFRRLDLHRAHGNWNTWSRNVLPFIVVSAIIVRRKVGDGHDCG